MRLSRIFRAVCALGAALGLFAGAALADSAAAPAAAETIGRSGLPLPRFVTLKAARVNMRVGPDRHKYPVLWSYQRQGLPVEIVQEYDNWRRIRDVDGALGWVNAAMLSGKRAALLAPKQQSGLVPLYAKADKSSAVVIKAEPGVIGAVKSCDGQWCLLDISRNRGFIRQNLLWGVYPHEVID